MINQAFHDKSVGGVWHRELKGWLQALCDASLDLSFNQFEK